MKNRTLILLAFLLYISPPLATAQWLNVTGKVIDNATAASIIHASIAEKKSGFGTITDENGTFSIYLNPGKVQLTFWNEKYETYVAAFELRKDTVLEVRLLLLPGQPGKKTKKESYAALPFPKQ